MSGTFGCPRGNSIRHVDILYLGRRRTTWPRVRSFQAVWSSDGTRVYLKDRRIVKLGKADSPTTAKARFGLEEEAKVESRGRDQGISKENKLLRQQSKYSGRNS